MIDNEKHASFLWTGWKVWQEIFAVLSDSIFALIEHFAKLKTAESVPEEEESLVHFEFTFSPSWTLHFIGCGGRGWKIAYITWRDAVQCWERSSPNPKLVRLVGWKPSSLSPRKSMHSHFWICAQNMRRKAAYWIAFFVPHECSMLEIFQDKCLGLIRKCDEKKQNCEPRRAGTGSRTKPPYHQKLVHQYVYNEWLSRKALNAMAAKFLWSHSL